MLMVTRDYVQEQLKLIGYKIGFRNNAEVNELVNILMPEENIYECVNGYYEGGYALLVITNDRLLLVDKKPFQFLTIEDVRFTQISQIFYNNRLIGASMSISLGVKNLKFNSFNKIKLRNLVIQVQSLISQYKNLGNLQANEQKDSLSILSKKIDLYLKLQAGLVTNNEINQSNQSFEATNQLEDLRSYGQKAILDQVKLSHNNHFLEQYKINTKKKIILSLGRILLIN